jgi:cleavage and polyadenylation specificity factor subunit 3
MMRLKSKLLSLNANKTNKVKVYSPRNCEELRIPFKTDKLAKVVGKLASLPPPAGKEREPQLVTGVLVQNDFKMSLMAPEDLREYAGLTTTTITCKQRLRLSAAGVDLIKWGLEGTFGGIEELPKIKNEHAADDTNGDSMDLDEKNGYALVAAYLVMSCVTVRCFGNGELELEWEGNMLNDGIADAVMAVLLGIESSPAAVKRKWSLHAQSMYPFRRRQTNVNSSRFRGEALPFGRHSRAAQT